MRLVSYKRILQKPTGYMKNYLLAIQISCLALIAQSVWSLFLAVRVNQSYRTFWDIRYYTYLTWGESDVRDDFYNDWFSLQSVPNRYLFLIGFVVAISSWSYRAHVFVNPISKHKRRWGRNWTVLGWLLPICSFFIPFLVNQETEKILAKDTKSISKFGRVWFFLFWSAFLLEEFFYGLWSLNGYPGKEFFIYLIASKLLILTSVCCAWKFFADMSTAIKNRESEIALITTVSLKNEAPLIENLSSPDAISVAGQIRVLGQLLAERLITQEEFNSKKTELLKRIE